MTNGQIAGHLNLAIALSNSLTADALARISKTDESPAGICRCAGNLPAHGEAN